jgi:hypothetical protein
MDKMDKEQFTHALGQTLKFYGKDLEQNDFSFWHNALSAHRWDDIRSALLEYTKRGKYAPKPADILDIVKELQGRRRLDKALPSPVITRSERSEQIAVAWMFWIKQWSNLTTFPSWPVVEGVTDEMAEEYLLLVNEEAKRCNEPGAIPEEFRIAEIWDRPDVKRPDRPAGLDPEWCHNCRSLRITEHHRVACS